MTQYEASASIILPAHLLTVAALEALPHIGAVLTLDDGSQVTLGLDDLPGLTPPSPVDHGLMVRRATGEADLYRVPPALAGQLAWALVCRPTERLTLMAVTVTPDNFTFTAQGVYGDLHTLTTPSDVHTQLGRPIPRLAGMPVSLDVHPVLDRTAPTIPARFFSFDIYPETPEGAACLSFLDPHHRIQPPDKA